METYSKLYWLTRLDNIKDFFMVISIILFIGVLICILFRVINYDEDEFYHKNEIKERIKKRVKVFKNIYWLTPIGFVFLIISLLTPTKNEMIFIIAGSKTIDFIQSDSSIAKIPSQTTLLISNFLDKQIKEIENK